MHDVLKEIFATIIIAAAILVIVAALGMAIVALALILPLALVAISTRPARAMRSEPLVLVQAREVAHRAGERTVWTDLAIAGVDAGRR